MRVAETLPELSEWTLSIVCFILYTFCFVSENKKSGVRLFNDLLTKQA